MLKIPTFVLGGLLILTGLLGYLLQDPGLSLTITGSLHPKANLKLSDGTQTVPINFQSGRNLSGGQQVLEIIKFNPEDYVMDLFGHEGLNTKAERQSRTNYVISKRNSDRKPASYWMATSKGEPLKVLLSQDFSANLHEMEEAHLRLVYVNDGDEPGPVELTAANWKGIKGDHEKGTSLAFGKSPTALIPSLLGLLLIALVIGSEANPNLRKHLMHAAATIALLSFGYITYKIPGILNETMWFRNEATIHVSILKLIAFIFSSGLLFIFLILCVTSFINARKEMAARPKPRKKEKEGGKKKDDDDDFGGDDDDFDDDDSPGKKRKEKKVSDKKEKDANIPTKPLGPTPKKEEGKLDAPKPSGAKPTEKKDPKDKERPSRDDQKKDEKTKIRKPEAQKFTVRDDSKSSGKAKVFALPKSEAKREEKSGDKPSRDSDQNKTPGDSLSKPKPPELKKERLPSPPPPLAKREETEIKKPADAKKLPSYSPEAKRENKKSKPSDDEKEDDPVSPDKKRD